MTTTCYPPKETQPVTQRSRLHRFGLRLFRWLVRVFTVLAPMKLLILLEVNPELVQQIRSEGLFVW